MQDKLELSLLLDYYGAFLTEARREILSLSKESAMLCSVEKRSFMTWKTSLAWSRGIWRSLNSFRNSDMSSIAQVFQTYRSAGY